MKLFAHYLLAILVFAGAGLPATAQTWQAAYQSGSLWLRSNTNTVSVADAAGNVFVGGEFTSNTALPGTATFGGTVLTSPVDSSQGFIAKLSPTGQWLWAVPVGPRWEVGSDRGTAVSGLALTPTNDVIATGVFTRRLQLGATTLVSAGDVDGYVGRLSGATGQWTWAERFGGPSRDVSADLALTPTGNVVLCGHFLSTQLTFGALTPLVLRAGQGSLFVAQLDGTTRQWQWATSARGNYSNRATAVAVDGSGRIVVAGNFQSDSLAMGALPPLAITLGLSGVRSDDGFVAQLSPTGQWLWSRSCGNSTQDRIHTIALTAAGEVAIGGEYDGLVTIGPSTMSNTGSFVAKLSAAGQWQWAASISGGQYIELKQVAFDGSGQVLATGIFPTQRAFFRPNLLQLVGAGAFVGRLSAAGNWQWALGVSGADAHSVLPRANGHVLVAGRMVGNPTVFGPISLPLVGAHQNVFVATLVPTSVGLAEEAAATAGFCLAPNPAHGTVRVELPAATATAVTVQLLDGVGRVVRTTPAGAGAAAVEVPLEGLATGLYVVRVGTWARRLLIE